MADWTQLGRLIIVIGVVLIAVGVLLVVAGKIPFPGRLPGDIRIERPGFSLFFPITTCIFLSLLGTLVLWLFFRR